MDFESPDVEKEFPGLYASDGKNQDRDSDYSDEEKVSKKELLAAIAKRKEKKDSKKDKGYVAFEGESSDDGATDDTRSPSKGKKSKSAFKFPLKEKKDKSFKIKDQTKKETDECAKESKKEVKESKKEHKESKKDKEHKKKKEPKVKLGKLKKKNSLKEEKALFGIPLQLAVDRNKCHDGIELPSFFRECLDYIEEHGLACEGIYRISGVKSKVQQLRAKYDHGEPVYLYEHEPHTVASLLKHFLRELPESVLTNELTPKFEEAVAIKAEQKKMDMLNKLFFTMPACNRLLLSWMFVHMSHIVSLEKRNKMSQQDVMITFSPVMQMSHQVINTFYKYREQLFQGVEITKYAPALQQDVSRVSLELPDTPAGIEDELNRQEALLAKLHEELNSGVRDKQKEEQLWEVQRVVTQLKRKLRFLKQPSTTKSSNDRPAKELSSVTEEVIDTRLREAPEKVAKENKDEVSEGVIEEKAMENDAEHNKVSSAEELNGKPVPIEEDSVETLQSMENKQTVSAEEHLPTVSLPQTNSVREELKPEEKPDPELEFLLLEERTLVLQQEELVSLNQMLRRKISSERLEVERLKGEIESCHQMNKYKQYSFDSSENSSSSDGSESEDVEDDDEDLVKILENLIIQNQELERKNADLNVQIHNEREACMNIKVQIKLLQHGVPAC